MHRLTPLNTFSLCFVHGKMAKKGKKSAQSPGTLSDCSFPKSNTTSPRMRPYGTATRSLQDGIVSGPATLPSLTFGSSRPKPIPRARQPREAAQSPAARAGPLHPGAAPAPNRESKGEGTKPRQSQGAEQDSIHQRGGQRSGPAGPEPAPSPRSRECPGLRCPGRDPRPPEVSPTAGRERGESRGSRRELRLQRPMPPSGPPGCPGSARGGDGAAPAPPRCRREARPGRAHLRWPLR